MARGERKPSAFNGLAALITGLTWMGQPPSHPSSRPDAARAPASWELPVVLGVTVLCLVAGVVIARIWSGEWGAAWVGVLAGLVAAALLLQPLVAIMRRVLR